MPMAASGPPRSVRILLIEDDNNEAALVEAALERMREPDKPTIRRVVTLREGLAALSTQKPDVVLLDIKLPDSSGLEGLDAIRRAHPDLTIVMRTGVRDDALALEALRRGAQDYLVKGEHSVALLWRSIRHAIERGRVADAGNASRSVEERARERQLIEAEASMVRGMLTHQATGGGRRAFQPGVQLGARYVLQEMIGEGSSSQVYAAKDLVSGRTVCVKHMHMGPGGLAAADLAREVRLSASFDHPNVVRILDFGTVWGEPYVVMEFAAGGSLARLTADGPIAPAIARAIMLDVLDGLAYIHSRDTLHLDLKPANIVLDAEGRAQVTDFGISLPAMGAGPLETQTGLGAPRIYGTPAYVAPEVLTGQRPTVRTDVYSAGALLYHMISGTPYLDLAGLDSFAMRAAIRETPPSRDAPGGPILEVALRALEKDPARRYAGAVQMRDALARAKLPSRNIPVRVGSENAGSAEATRRPTS